MITFYNLSVRQADDPDTDVDTIVSEVDLKEQYPLFKSMIEQAPEFFSADITFGLTNLKISVAYVENDEEQESDEWYSPEEDESYGTLIFDDREIQKF